jgi:hypothetical protein
MSPSFQDGASGPPTRKSSHGHTTTLPRVMDDFVVEGPKIDHCFKLYDSERYTTIRHAELMYMTDTSHNTMRYSPFWTLLSTRMSIMSSRHFFFGVSS